MTLILSFLLVMMFAPLIAIIVPLIGLFMMPANHGVVSQKLEKNNEPRPRGNAIPNSDEIRQMSDSAHTAAV